MKKLLGLLLFCFGINGMAQNSDRAQNPDRVIFEYDSAGNQIIRRFCINCFDSRISHDSIKDFSELKEEDLFKFSPTDNISYYPNPVSEELYLKWELINDVKVSRIDVYNINGQLIKSFSNLINENNKTIPFQELSVGTYSVLMTYSNSQQKQITIIKK